MTNHPVNPAADEPDPVARQLMHQAQLIARLRRDLDQRSHDATDAIAGLLARVEDFETRAFATAASPAAWCWRDLGPHAQIELMGQLESWTAWLRHRCLLTTVIDSPEHDDADHWTDDGGSWRDSASPTPQRIDT